MHHTPVLNNHTLASEIGYVKCTGSSRVLELTYNWNKRINDKNFIKM